MKVDDILEERHRTYGAFIDVAEVAAELRHTIMRGLVKQKKFLAGDQEEALVMISSKVARVVVGDADHVDSWRDIAGYATLVADRLEGKVR